MGQHSGLTMVGFFMELTYHEQSDRTRNENPRASGHLFPTGREPASCLQETGAEAGSAADPVRLDILCGL